MKKVRMDKYMHPVTKLGRKFRYRNALYVIDDYGHAVNIKTGDGKWFTRDMMVTPIGVNELVIL
jgi:hypothetical protein